MDRSGVIIIEGHVQGLANTRALGEKGIPVLVVDTGNCIARYSKYCRKFYRCPQYDTPEFIQFLIEVAKRERINGWLLLPSNDHAVYNISKNEKLLKSRYNLITPGIDIVERIYNKKELIIAAMNCLVPVPLSWFHEASIEEIYDKVTYPCLIKGKNGLSFYRSTRRKAFQCNSKSELSSTVNEILQYMPLDSFFIQELIPFNKNKTISFAAFALYGKILTYWAGIKLREHPIHFGTSTYSKSVDGTDLLPLASNLLSELNYTGICEIEFLKDPRDGKYKLIEVNARTWLWTDLARICGVDFVIYAYNYVNSIENKYETEYKTGKEWMHYLIDFPFSILGLIKGEYKIREIVLSYVRLPLPAVFKISDILPSISEILLIPHMLKHR